MTEDTESEVIKSDSGEEVVAQVVDASPSTSVSEVKVETEDSKYLKEARRFIYNVLASEEDKKNAELFERVELSPERKRDLFLAQDYTPTKLEVRVREENIKGWRDHELTRLGKASAENNSIVANLERKDSLIDTKPKDFTQSMDSEVKKPKESLVERFGEMQSKHRRIGILRKMGLEKEDAEGLHSTMVERDEMKSDMFLIAYLYTATKSYVEENTGKGKVLPRDSKELQEVVLNALDRLKMLDCGTRVDLNISRNISSKQTISPENIIDIGSASDEKWNQLLNTLKEIPYVNPSTIKIPSLIPILENGLSEKQQKYLERLRDNVIVEKNSHNIEYLVAAIFIGDELINYYHNQQNLLAIKLFEGGDVASHIVTDRSIVNKYDTNVYPEIAFQMASLKYCPLLLDHSTFISGGMSDSMISYLSFSKFMTTEVQRRYSELGRIGDGREFVFSENVKEKFKLIGDLVRYRRDSPYTEHASSLAYHYATGEGPETDRDLVRWTNLYFDLGFRMDEIESFQKLILHDPRGAILNIEDTLIEDTIIFSDIKISDRESLQSFLQQSQENRDLVKISHLLFPFVAGRDHRSLKREDVLEMYKVENGEFILKEKFFEYVFSRDRLFEDLLMGDFSKILNSENISKLSNPDAKQFWGLAEKHLSSSMLFGFFLTEIRENSFDYGSFFRKYNGERGLEDFLLEKTVSALQEENIEFSEKENVIKVFSKKLDEKLEKGDKEGYKFILEKFTDLLNVQDAKSRAIERKVFDMLRGKLTYDLLRDNREYCNMVLNTLIIGLNLNKNILVRQEIYASINGTFENYIGIPLKEDFFHMYPLLENSAILKEVPQAIFIPKEELQQLVENGITVEKYIGEAKLNIFVPPVIIQDISYWKDGELNKEKIYDFFVSNGLPEDSLPERMIDNFKKGGEIFGKEKMVKYIQGHPEVTLHDRLYEMDSIERLYLASKLSPEAFFGNILNGVVLDDSSYPEGSSYNHLNTLMGSIDMNIFTQEGMDKLVMQLKKYQEAVGDIEYAKNLVTDMRILFSSWKNFERGVAVLDQLKSGELLDIIVELQDSGQSKIANWIKTLGFHRESKVSLSALLKFAKRPDEFLGADDQHAPNQFHSKKRPSEYLERGLLSGTELIKSLIEGEYDKIQTFKPYEKKFRIPNNPERKIEDIVREAIGSRRDSIPGKSLNPGRLFAEMSNKFKEKGKSLEEFLKGNLSLEEYWGDEYWSVGEEIQKILFNEEYGLPKEFITKNFIEIIAQVHQKSDPMAVIAGDDTACCMAFGTGKNNVYMFNPSIGMFTVRIVRGNGDSRTIAQSVLTLDQDVGTDASKLKDIFVRDPKSIEPDIKEKILKNDEFHLVCDNIEVAPNYSKLVPKIKEVYKGFFSEYLSKKNNVSKPVNKEKIVIGTGYSDISGWDTMPNHFVPVAPPSYSDNVHSESFYSKLNTKSETEVSSSEVVTTGVTELGVEDSLQVAVIESEAYSDNKSLQEGLVRMMNRIIAVQVFNARNNRPNMCMKYVGDDNSTKAYMVAYERANTKEDRHLYIEDFASRKGEGLGAGRILRSLIEKYKENYIDKGDIIPIVMEARDQTSYQLLKRQIDRISEMLGIKFVEDEIGQNLVGTDTMHSIILRPQIAQEEVPVAV